jgi:hypothetical protein
MLFMSFYSFAQLLGHRCLCDGSEKLTPGEEFTTMACTFWCVRRRNATHRASCF